MRALRGLFVGVVVLGGCGKVEDKPDAAPVIDAMPDAAGVCTANANSCGAGNALYMCDAEGTQLTKVQDCQYGCTTDHCNACAANTTFCNGDDLVMCSAGGDISNPTTCQFGCQGNACNTCMPSTTYCSGQNAVTCTAAGQPGASTNCGAAGCMSGVCNSCTPNTTTCQGDNLVVCNAGGTIASATSCALGCSTTGTVHCNALVPAFGVSAPSGTQPDLLINDNATLDITNCAALDVKLTLGSTTTAVPSTQIASVSQAASGGPPICVVKYGKITINDTFTLSITNSATTGNMLSLQGTGDIDVSGQIYFQTLASGPSPGGSTSVIANNANNKYMAPGPGGAGGARAGGNGGACTACSSGSTVAGAGGGAAVTLGNALRGGSQGGQVLSGTTVVAGGGRGGGGLHLVSNTKVTFGASAKINLNGGGGTGPFLGSGTTTAGGGGSGGQLLVEAPIVNISAGAIAAANGGGGAGAAVYSVDLGGGLFRFFHYNGQSGQLSATRATGGDIPNTTSGDGGYESDGTANPSTNGSASDSMSSPYGAGGGGGAKGFITLRGRASTNVMIAFGAVISPAPVLEAVNKQ